MTFFEPVEAVQISRNMHVFQDMALWRLYTQDKTRCQEGTKPAVVKGYKTALLSTTAVGERVSVT